MKKVPQNYCSDSQIIYFTWIQKLQKHFSLDFWMIFLMKEKPVEWLIFTFTFFAFLQVILVKIYISASAVLRKLFTLQKPWR